MHPTWCLAYFIKLISFPVPRNCIISCSTIKYYHLQLLHPAGALWEPHGCVGKLSPFPSNLLESPQSNNWEHLASWYLLCYLILKITNQELLDEGSVLRNVAGTTLQDFLHEVVFYIYIYISCSLWCRKGYVCFFQYWRPRKHDIQGNQMLNMVELLYIPLEDYSICH